MEVSILGDLILDSLLVPSCNCISRNGGNERPCILYSVDT